jgi:hypothetical protein
MSAPARRRWPLLLGALAIAVGISLTVAIVLARKPDPSHVSPPPPSSDWADNLAAVKRDGKVPKLAVKRAPPPERSVATSGLTQQATGMDQSGRMALSVKSPLPAKDQPPDSGVRTLSEHDFSRIRAMLGHLRRIQQQGPGSTESGQ